MGGSINFFEAVTYLEPKCPKCGVIIDYGVNTKYNQKKGGHLCGGCGVLLK